MSKLGHHIHTILMQRSAPGLDGVIQSFLSLASVIYGGAQRLHRDIYRRGWREVHRLSCAVVSIGNLVTGGTGKTPMTHYLAALSQRMGYQPVILSRGYGGRAERCGGVVSDGRKLLMLPDAAGDEPFMLASTLTDIPVVVGRDRFRSGQLAIERFHPDVIILDDGFQHLRLKRDLDILLLDGCRPLGNGHLLPRGSLREPPSAIQRAHAVVLTRTDNGRVNLGGAKPYIEDKPSFHSSHLAIIDCFVPCGKRTSPVDAITPVDPKIIDGRRVYLFSGIARNDDFIRTAQQLGAKVVGQKAFPDHYNYRLGDLSGISRAAVVAGADCIATTSKDFVRIGPQATFSLDLLVVSVALTFTDKRFDTFIADSFDRMVPKKPNRHRST